MSKTRYQIKIYGMSEMSAERWSNERYCFVPLYGPCVSCGGYSFAYAAYIKSNGVLGVRAYCRTCGHNDDVRRCDFVSAEMSKKTKAEVDKRLQMRAEKEGWT